MATTLNLTITNSADDGSYHQSGSSSSTSFLNGVYGGQASYAFARFVGATIPQGATITSAILQLGIDDIYGTTWGSLRGIDLDNTPALGSVTRLNLPYTDASTPISRTAMVATLDVTAIVQEIVSRSGWASGNALGFLGDPTGADDEIYFVNGPTLTVTYDEAATPPAPNKELIITATGAGSWTPPAGVSDIWVGVHGGGGAGGYGSAGGGGAWSGGDLSVTPGQPISYYVAASQAYAQSGAETVGQDTWFGSPTTILAKGANGWRGGQASAGFGPSKYSGGSTRYVNPDTGVPLQDLSPGSNGGCGAAASRYGDGTDGLYNARDDISTGGTSPGGGGHPGTNNSEGGGGFAPSSSAWNGTGGQPGGGSKIATSTRGQIVIRWYEADTTVRLNGSVSLASSKVAAASSHTAPRTATSAIRLNAGRLVASSTFTQPARQGAGTISFAPLVAASGQSIVPAVGSGGVSLRSPKADGLSTFAAHPAPPSSGGGSGETVTEKFKTAGTFNWTVPAGVTSVTAKVWGPGGNGAAGIATRAGGGAGGGGFRQATNYPVTPGQVIQFRVGSPGVSSFFVSTAVCQANSGGNGSGQLGRRGFKLEWWWRGFIRITDRQR